MAARIHTPLTEEEQAEREEYLRYRAEHPDEIFDQESDYHSAVFALGDYREALKSRRCEVFSGEIDTTTRNHFSIGIDTYADYVPPDDLIDGLISRVSRNGIVGPSGSGKSFLIKELAACVVTGEPFAGRDVLRRGGFGYFSYESSGTLEPRWRGLERKYGGLLRDSRGRALVPYFPVKRPMPLDSDRGWGAMKDTVKRMQDCSIELFGVPLVAAAIDTVHASQMVAKENDSDAWAKPLEKLLEISEDHQLAVIISHHSGKTSDGPDGKPGEGTLWRGSGAAPAALDNLIAVKMNKREGRVSRRYMFLEKSKDGETGYIADIETSAHKIGFKSNGNALTTLTLSFVHKSEEDQRKEKADEISMRAKARAEAWRPSGSVKELMKVICLTSNSEGRAVELPDGSWTYTASKIEVENTFKAGKGGNGSRNLSSAVARLKEKLWLTVDESQMTFSLKMTEPVRIGAFS